ncbi:MAG: sulfite exporter TauE/SafE family protein, partial [Candidatus Helarchaeota archaeon]
EKQNKSKNEMIIEGNDLQGRKKWYIISRKKVDAQGQEYVYNANIIYSIPLSFAAGFLSSLLGIGGGSLYIPVYVFLCGMSIHMAIACSIFSIFISMISSSITFIILGEVNYIVGIIIIIGMIIGAQIGAFIAKKIKSRYLKLMAAIMMTIIAIQMILFAIFGKPT